MFSRIVILVVVSSLGVSAALLRGSDRVAARETPEHPGGIAVAGDRIPARLLDCDIGRITNFDASKEQKPSDYRFEGHHALRLFLPAAPVRTGPPPSALTPPEPVDPHTRILADPDRLARGTDAKPFYRVVDYWPERVELTTPISARNSNLVVLDSYDPARNVVNLFMTAAADGMTFDLSHLYAGTCRVTLGAEAEHHSTR